MRSITRKCNTTIFFQNRSMGLTELRAYITGTLPRHPDEYLEHNDRIRADGCTAFIQYQTALKGSGERVVFFAPAKRSPYVRVRSCVSTNTRHSCATASPTPGFAPPPSVS
nr:hypothetical protein GCM10020185_88150 [Pseudomonas brassicacearum subsp. brassicacearum]